MVTDPITMLTARLAAQRKALAALRHSTAPDAQALAAAFHTAPYRACPGYAMMSTTMLVTHLR